MGTRISAEVAPGFVAATITSAASSASNSLEGLDTDALVNLATCWVEESQSLYIYEASSVVAADGANVVAPASGTGRWLLLQQGPVVNPIYAQQATWYIDPTNGSDTNDGLTSGTALATLAELQRRVSGTAMTQTVNVYVLNDIAEPIRMDRYTDGAYQMVFHGTTTQTATGTLATYANVNHATPTATRISSAAIADWTPYALQRVRMTTGAAAGATAFVLRANPKASGLNFARLTPFLSYNVATGVPTLATPAPGDTFVVETLSAISGIDTDFRSTANTYGSQPLLVIKDFAITSPSELCLTGSDGSTALSVMLGCTIDAYSITGKPYAAGSLFINNAPSITEWLSAFACGFKDLYLFTLFCYLYLGYNTIFDDTACFFDSGTMVQVSGAASAGAQWFDVTSGYDAIWMYGASTFLSSSAKVSGDGTTALGLRLQGAQCIYEDSTNKPTVTGTAGDVGIGDEAQPTTVFTWANAPVILGNGAVIAADERTPDAFELTGATTQIVGGTTFTDVNLTALGIAMPTTLDYVVEVVYEAPTGAVAAPQGFWVTNKATGSFRINAGVDPGAGTDYNLTLRVKG